MALPPKMMAVLLGKAPSKASVRRVVETLKEEDVKKKPGPKKPAPKPKPY